MSGRSLCFRTVQQCKTCCPLFNRCLARPRKCWKQVLVFLLISVCALLLFCTVEMLIKTSPPQQKCSKSASCESIPSNGNASPDAITLFVRVGGKVAELRRHLYCNFLRSSVLFWPASLGKTVIVLDEESELDHEFASNITRQIHEHFPDRNLEIRYEPLPSDPTVLEFPGSPKTPGYNRQLWSSFFLDFYTNDSIIAWMDADSWFSSPVTKSTIFHGTKVRVLGTECSVHKRGWVPLWMHSTEVALGLPSIADFMTYFPAYIYRDTFINCREYLLKRFNTNNFEKAFKQFYTRGQYISPVTIVLNFAWYFERDRYAWNLEICTNLTEYNERLPSNHAIRPEHLVDTLSMPLQTAFHFPQMPNMGPYIRSSHCLSHEAAGNAWAKCSNYSASLHNNLVLFVHDIVRLDMPIIPPQCSGARANSCLQILKRHYSQVGSEIKQNKRKMDWKDLETVDELANEVLCSSFSTIHIEPSEAEKDNDPRTEKHGYGKTGFDKRNKEADGLFYLKTVYLPKQLDKNLIQFLKKFPKKVVENDGRKLARHIKNRGRPTDQTWKKYRESKRRRDVLAESEVNPEDILKLESQESESTIFGDQSDEINEGGEEDELDEENELINSGDERVQRYDSEEFDEEEIKTNMETTEADNRRANNVESKIRNTKKPKRAEYKVIRYDKRESAAYAASRIPASYGATLRVFHEICRREPDFKPETLLDFGSGTGMAVWAAHEKWGDSIREYQCVDVSQDMNKLAEYLLRGGEGFKNSLHIPRVYFKRFLPVSNLITYNVVVASYALSEIPKTSLRQMAVRSLWGKTSDFLVIIEHGNSEGFEITSDARSLVLKEGGYESTEGENSADAEFQFLDPTAEEMDSGFVFSPCPHDVECARSNAETRDHPCNFEQRVQLAFCQRNTRLKKYGFHTERFSYIVLRKGERDPAEKSWPRVLQPLKLRKRHVICKLCCSSGDLKQKILTKRKDGDIYKCARHLTRWGDLLPDPEDRERPVKSKLTDVKGVSSTQ